MRLALRLVVAFGLLAALSTAGLGLALRESRVIEETARFRHEVSDACKRVAEEVERKADDDRRLLAGECGTGSIVDQAFMSFDAKVDEEQRLGPVSFKLRVPLARESFGLDGLVLATQGEVLAADPMPLLTVPPAELKTLLAAPPEHFLRGTKNVRGLISRCRRDSGGRSISLIGVRQLGPLLKRLAPSDLVVTEGKAMTSASHEVRSCQVRDSSGSTLDISVSKPKEPLVRTLEKIDQTILYASLAFVGLALLFGVVLARSLSRPLAVLAEEASKVARGEAKPIKVRGSREVKDLGSAFNRMLRDLEATRRRLAATSRVAAWREVARRVAHEVKNPLAPIRAAVETLRRLRAREDPAFDEYFDEATRTVLDEVHRIANIVTEFTKFARLPPPKPAPENVVELAQRVIGLQRAVAPDIKLEVRPKGAIPEVTCDADQIVQVLTNLVQNGVEAVKGLKAPQVVVDVELEGNDRVAITVRDSGPGVARELMPRLFEPYATTKAQGTGLGLAIAQRIAVEHGGELAYVSDGVGAAFRLTLPIAGPLSDPGRGPESEIFSEAPPS